jgi:hypothetical protein
MSAAECGPSAGRVRAAECGSAGGAVGLYRDRTRTPALDRSVMPARADSRRGPGGMGRDGRAQCARASANRFRDFLIGRPDSGPQPSPALTLAPTGLALVEPAVRGSAPGQAVPYHRIVP